MPNGATHSKATLVCAIIAPSVDYVLRGSPGEAFMLFTGCAAGLLITPDLDVNGGSYSSFILKIVGGEIASIIWRTIWWPYSRIPHRSFWSHSIVVSTLLRIAYAAVFMAPVFLMRWLLFNDNLEVLQQSAKEFLPLFIGLAMVDSLHIVMDYTSTTFKLWRRKIK